MIIHALINVLLFVIQFISNLFIYSFILRFLIELIKNCYYEEDLLYQWIVLITNTLFSPIRSCIPRFIPSSCLLIMLGYLCLIIQLIFIELLTYTSILWIFILIIAFIKLILNIVWIYIILLVVYSFFKMTNNYKNINIIFSLIEPLLRVLSKFIHVKQNNKDITPILLLLILISIQIFLSSIFYIN